MTGIPEQLVGQERFIKIDSESKAPTVSPEGPFFSATDTELQGWIQSGGNVGLNLGPLVALDVDSDQFRELAGKHLRSTFSVRSGSGGEHRYYKCDWSGRAQFTSGEEDLGSVRSGNWYLVVPPSTHPNGEQYYVLRDKPIQTIAVSQLEDFLEAVDETANTARRRRQQQPGGAGCVGSNIPIAKIPDEYPERPAEWRTARNWLSANGLLESLNRTTCSDWSGLEFKIAKCLAEGGFSESVISDALDRLHHNSKWHRRGSTYRSRTVRNAIVAACEDEYVEFDFPDDSGKWGKPDEGKPRHRTMSQEATYSTRESVIVVESDGDPQEAEDGERMVKATRTEVEDNGEEYEFVQILAGTVERNDTFGVSPKWQKNGNGQDKTRTIGSSDPEYLRTVAQALEELADGIEQ